MIEQIVGILKSRRFSGEVVDVQMILEEYDPITGTKHNFHRQLIIKHHGYNQDGLPITESYYEAVYDVRLRNHKGETRTFRILGKPPEIGSQQNYHLGQQRE